MTKQKLLRVLNAHSSDRVSFAVREPCDARYVAPANLWERIKQVFTGPVTRVRAGEVEVAVILDRGYEQTMAEIDAYAEPAKHVMPAGVKISYVTYSK